MSGRGTDRGSPTTGCGARLTLDPMSAVQLPNGPALKEVAPRPGIRVKHLTGCQETAWDGETRGVWVDVETPTPEQVQRLKERFPINHLALEDALQIGHWARFEVYPEHAFLIFRTLAEPAEVTERTERVSLFWYPELNSLLTIRNEPVNYLESVWEEVGRFLKRTPVEVIYTLLQRGTDTFFEFLDSLEDCTDSLEQRVFVPGRPSRDGQTDRTTAGFATEIFSLKRVMIAARRLVSSSRENVAQFSRHVAVVDAEGSIYLRDISDHLTRVYDGLDSARDVLTSLLDVHLNVQSNRMNEIMKTLTTVSTIFLPLTFLAGVWGMNFDFMPELAWPAGYGLAWLVFVMVAVGLALYFKRRGWW